MAASTAPSNPLAQSLARFTGENALSTTAGTSPISYENLNYQPGADIPVGFRPAGDIINVSSQPGTGATTAETWGHEIELEKLKNVQAQFAYEQQQNILANARLQAQLQLEQQKYGSSLAEQQRQYQLQQSAAGLEAKKYGSSLAEQQRQYELQQSGLAIQQAEAAQKAGLYPLQTQAAQLANQTAAADLLVKQQAQADRDALFRASQSLLQQQAYLAGAPVSAKSDAAYNTALANPYYKPAQISPYGVMTAPPSFTYPSVAPATNYGYVGSLGSGTQRASYM